MRKALVSKFYLTLILAGFFSSAPSYSQSITIQGRVATSAGAPINGSGVVFRVQIVTPNSNLCVLYDETQTLDLSQTNGLFSININGGTGTRNAPSTYTLDQAISNRSILTVDASYCPGASGTGPIQYSPTFDANRKVVISFRDPSSMSGFETIPTMDLNPLPYAMESTRLGGYTASSFLRVLDSGVPGAPAPLSTGQFTELQNLIAGTSANYMSTTSGSSTGAQLPTVSGNPSSPSTGSIWFDTSGSGALKYYDSSGTIRTVGTGSGSSTISQITAGTGLLGGGTTGNITLSLNSSGVTAGTYGGASSVPQFTVDAFGRITSVTPVATGAVPASGNAGEFLKFNGTNWISTAIGIGDLQNGAGLPLYSANNCPAFETLYLDSGSNQFKCKAITGLPVSALPDSSGVTAGATYQSVTVDGKGRVTAGTNPTTLAGYNISDGVKNLTGVPNISAGLDAAYPAHLAGQIFVATDSHKIYRDNGTTWELIGSATGTGGTITKVAPGVGLSGGGTSGDVTLDLTNVGTAGTYPKVTTDAQGRVTAGAALVEADIPSLSWSKIATPPTTIAGYGITDGVKNAAGVPSISAGNDGAFPAHAAGQIFVATDSHKIYRDNGTTWDLIGSATGTGGTITNVVAGTGLTGGGATGAVTLTLGSVGTPGTYSKVTTDAQGRVTAGAALAVADLPSIPWSQLTGTPTTISTYGITDAIQALGSAKAIRADTAANRGAAGNSGRVFIASDTGAMYYDNGSSWVAISSGSTATLGGDVTGAPGANTVAQVGGSSAANVHAAELRANAATDASTASTIVMRDAAKGFSADAGNLSSLVLRASGGNTATLSAPTVTTSYSLKLPATQGSSGNLLSVDASGNLTWAAPTAATSVAFTPPMVNAGTASAPNVSLPKSTASVDGYLAAADFTNFASKLASTLTNAYIYVGNGSNVATGVAVSGDLSLANTGAFTVNKIKGTSVSAVPTTAGQMLRFDGTSYTPGFVGMADLRSKTTGVPALGTSCTSSQTLTWDSAADTLSCQNIGIDASQISTGTISAARLPASASLWQAGASSATYYNAGNVGIGTSSPAFKLDIVAAASDGFRVQDASGNYRAWFLNNAGAGEMRLYSGSSTLGTLLNSSGNSYFNGGNVGIGTSAPSGPLEVSGLDDASIYSTVFSNTGPNAPQFTGRKARGTAATYSAVQADDVLFALFGRGATSSSTWSGNTAGMRILAAENFSATNQGSYLTLNTTPLASTSRFERLRITSEGKFGVNTTTPTSYFHLGAGAAGVGLAPLKFTSGTLQITPEAGAVEFDGSNLYYTDSTGTRRTLNSSSGAGTTNFANPVTMTGAGTGLSVTNNATVGGTFAVTGATTLGGVTSITNSTASTTTGSGALTVAGGLGVAGTVNGAILAAGNGTAALPSQTFTSDLATGSWLPAASTYAISTAGTERLRINSTGNMGVGGTPGTVASLQVFGGIYARGGAPGGNGVNNNGYAFSGGSGDNDSGMYSTADGLLQFYTQSAEAMRIQNGKVAIGTTTTPVNALTTYSAAAATSSYTHISHSNLATSSTASINKVGVDIQSTGAWSGTSAVNTGLNVNVAGGTTNYAATFMGGNVGIGVSTPSNLLTLSTSSTNDGLVIGGVSTAGNTVSTQLRANMQAGSYNSITQNGDAGLIFSGTTIGGAKGFVFAPWYGSTGGIRMDGSGNVGMGISTPSAILHLKAGSATANTAPLKFASGTLLGTTEAGAVEYDGTSLYYTDSGGVRRTLASSAASGTQTFANSVSITAPGTGLAVTNNATIGGTLGITGLTTMTGGFSAGTGSITSTAASSSTTTGSMVVAGGMGVAGTVNANILAAANGAAATPSFTFTSDLTTGMWAPGSNGLAFSTNGTEKMRILTGGNVGIGTISPNSKLDISGSLALQSGLSNTSTRPAVGAATLANGELRAYSANGIAADDGFLRLSAGGGTAASSKSWIDLSGYSQVADMLQNISFGTNGSERMRIASSGNVGIGTTSPITKLDVAGMVSLSGGDTITSNPPSATTVLGWKLGLWSNSFAMGVANSTIAIKSGKWVSLFGGNPANDASTSPDSNAKVSFNTTIGDALFSGSVGIGTTNPAVKLDVRGGGFNLGTNSATSSSFEIDPSSSQQGTFRFTTDATANYIQSALSTASGSGKDLRFGPYGSTSTWLNITSGGNVGIGTTNPSNNLTVVGDGGASSGPAVLGIVGTNASAAGAFSWATNSTNANLAANASFIHLIGKANSNYNSAYYGFHYGSSGSTSNYLTLGLYGKNDIMNIAGTGFVGIGSTAPRTALDVNGAIQAGNYPFVGAAAVNTPSLEVGGSAPTSSNQQATIIFHHQANSATQLRYTNNVLYYEGAGNGYGSGVASMSVGGNLSLGGIAPTSYQLQLSVDSAAKPGTSTWIIASDKRLKDIRGKFSRSLEALEQLHPIYFNYKKDNALKLPSNQEFVGIIAQDAEKAVPESVSKDEKGFLHLSNDAIIWTMVNSIKELAAKLSSHESDVKRELASVKASDAAKDEKIKKLEQENDAMKARMDRLEKLITSHKKK